MTHSTLSSNEKKTGKLEVALEYARLDFPVFPIKPHNKKPPLTEHGLKDATTNIETIRNWWLKWPDANIGIRCNGLLVIDADGDKGKESIVAIESTYEKLPATWVVRTGGGGTHVIYRVPESLNIRPGAGKYGFENIDVRANDSYIIAAGSSTNKEYKTIAGTPEEIADAPQWLIDFIISKQAGEKKPATPLVGKIAKGRRNSELASLAGTMRRRGATQDAIEVALLQQNKENCSPPLPESEVIDIAQSISRYTPGGNHNNSNHGDPKHTVKYSGEKPSLDDIGNSERFTTRHGANFHYVAERRVWQMWDGKVWRDDTRNQVLSAGKETAKSILLEAYEETDDNQTEILKKFSKTSSSNMRVKAMIELSTPDLAVIVKELDNNQHLLNVNNGTINLRTGKLNSHERADLITSVIDIDYVPDARSEMFESFLNDIFEGDRELTEYMRVWFGYCATGSQIEQKFQFWFGPLSNNGKSTLASVIKHVLGPYAGEIDPANFMLGKNQNTIGPNEALAGLYNKRVVFATEIQEGMKLNSALIKRMRGGESIHFERKFEHGFDAEPTYKLILSGNHRPEIKDTTNATWRSMDNVPFNYYVTEDKRIKNLSDILIREHGKAVLAWVVSGGIDWYKTGLPQQPAVIKTATQEYRNNEDLLHDFISENCLIQSGESILVKELYTEYKTWAEANDVYKPMGKTEFNDRLREKNLRSDRGHGNKLYWYGISTLTDIEKQNMVTFNGEKVTNPSLTVTLGTENLESSIEKSSCNKTFQKTTNKSNQSNPSNDLPDCPDCGRCEWVYLETGELQCPCGYIENIS